ncbi:hypothetical protein J7T55_006276 [Diaporthe amygdali]|uniref:uncharacterized protein n=1 Tax=Phomopsis amygdali TaxID=1214568 RepID=UPI0022FDC403|nr:uncharacterized protein J7T55_006276 [Diaporthe amygdali]KAJ0124933.1 hypothetical protein J7T55_006276 [Diaporthe amygdali]
MSPPDKRGGAGASKGPTHVFRGGSPRKEMPASSSSSASSAARSSNVIAAPPRAQLSSSPSPESQSRTPSGSGPPFGGSSNGTATPMSRRSSNAPSTRSLAVSALSSTEAGMKEKDARISTLERELELMETEFQRELDKLSRNESETASFWQAKHSALNQQFLRTDTELRLLRDEMRAREAETEDLTRGWRDALRAELKGREDEIRGLQAQIRGLKEWVSTSTRADGTTSDEVFGSGMANLGNSLQNWVITYFRKVKIDLFNAGETALQELAELVPMYEELARTAKIQLLQSIVSRVLVERVFRAYFVGLSPDQEQQLRQTERLMTSFVLRKEAVHKMQVQTVQTADDVVAHINRVVDSLTSYSAANADSSNASANSFADARHQALRQLVGNAIELSRLLVVQKAVFEVWMPEIVPHQQIMFDHATMEDIGGEDEESLIQREIFCVTFPGLIKQGDENGGQLQFRNIISKAKVLCSPE